MKLPTSWQWVNISDITDAESVEKIDPKKFGEGTFQYVDISSVDNNKKEITGVTHVLNADAPSRARQFVKSGDILVSTVRPNLNAVALITDLLNGAVCSTGFAVLRSVDNLVNRNFLFFWIKSSFFIEELSSKAKGANYPAVSFKDVLSVKIPLPPLEEQQYIVEILQQAEELRRLRQDSLANAEKLASALFLEMFGDPVKNSMGWDDSSRLEKKADIVSGVTKGQKSQRKTTREVPYLAVANVQDKYLNLNNVKKILATDDEIEKYRLRVNDLLLTEGGDPDKLGRGALWGNEIDECIHQNHVFRVRLNSPDLNPIFLKFLVASSRGKSYFLRVAKQTTGIASINISQLKAFSLLIPPLTLQEMFAERIREIERNEAQLRVQLLDLNDFLAALQSQAFTGKLTESWREQHPEAKPVKIHRRKNTSVSSNSDVYAEDIVEVKLPPLLESREWLWRELSYFQKIILVQIYATQDYFAENTLDTLIGDLPADITFDQEKKIKKILEQLVALGLIVKVSVQGRESGFVTAYRALREGDDSKSQDSFMLESW